MAPTLPLLRCFGADAAVGHRSGRNGWHTLTDALDNPDGDRLLAVEQAEADRARRVREEDERCGPTCTRCSAKFSDERWAGKERGWNDDGLCAGCRQAAADEKAREEAERERAAAEAAVAEANGAAPGGAAPDPASPRRRPLTCGGVRRHPVDLRWGVSPRAGGEFAGLVRPFPGEFRVSVQVGGQ